MKKILLTAVAVTLLITGSAAFAELTCNPISNIKNHMKKEEVTKQEDGDYDISFYCPMGSRFDIPNVMAEDEKDAMDQGKTLMANIQDGEREGGTCYYPMGETSIYFGKMPGVEASAIETPKEDIN